jgi:pimeloyl-ACP methyl ester carboxylesterase
MLFLHGHPDSWALYEAQLREFGRDHLVVAPNLRGYPPSDAPDAVEPMRCRAFLVTSMVCSIIWARALYLGRQ